MKRTAPLSTRRERAAMNRADAAARRYDAEQFFDERMRGHQEDDGSFACDTHVMLDHAIAALKQAGFDVRDYE